MYQEVDALPIDIDEHNADVASAEAAIEDIVESRFTDEKTNVTRAEYPQQGYYHSATVPLLAGVWKYIVVNARGKDLKSVIALLTPNIQEMTKPETDGDAQKIGGIVIGRGNELERKKIENVIRTLLTDEIIIGALIDLSSETPAYEARLKAVNKAASQISRAIDADAYWTKAACCPTPLHLLWNYIFG